MDLRLELQNRFGLDDFRPAQEGVIRDVLAGRDVLCVMPTGAGKSLCYQLPASISDGLTVVVSPLISLMEDQSQQLRDEGIPAAVLNSSLPAAVQREVIAELEDGFAGLLYLAPERLFAPNFQQTLSRLKPKLLAVDEAHCISMWGHDFRPEYSRLGEARRQLGLPPTIALTATATENVRDDIIRQLELRDPTVVVTGFDRPTLIYESYRVPKVIEKNEQLVDLLRGETGSSIVYCATRRAVEEVAGRLAGAMPNRLVVPYHAGMDTKARTGNQERFMRTAGSVAVATNAFGMGINKPDIRLVAHYNIPGTLEAYYQEAGRAGRDGRPARCVVLYSFQDRKTHEFFIEKLADEAPPGARKEIARRQERAYRKLEEMIRYTSTTRCRRQMILDYFGDETKVTNCLCDVCRHGKALPAAIGLGAESAAPVVMSDEAVLVVRQILSAIARCHGKFGVGVVAEMLAGSDTERTTRWQLNQLTTFGLLKIFPVKRIIAMLHRVLESGLARQRDPDGAKFRPVVELTAAGVAVMKGEQFPPAALADLLPRKLAQPAIKTTSATGKPASPDQSEPDLELDGPATDRFERLRHLRSRLARDTGMPPYIICHDATLKLIALSQPAELADLESIRGLGRRKIELYGKAILDELRSD